MYCGTRYKCLGKHKGTARNALAFYMNDRDVEKGWGFVDEVVMKVHMIVQLLNSVTRA